MSPTLPCMSAPPSDDQSSTSARQALHQLSQPSALQKQQLIRVSSYRRNPSSESVIGLFHEHTPCCVRNGTTGRLALGILTLILLKHQTPISKCFFGGIHFHSQLKQELLVVQKTQPGSLPKGLHDEKPPPVKVSLCRRGLQCQRQQMCVALVI